MTQYLTSIGLEFHAELKTKTKIFCSCPTDFSGDPNTHVCPVCLGLPGVLPVLNRHAVELAVIAGLSLNCEISRFSKFDRKNYFYPDLPKGYQITQYPLPICRNGFLLVKDSQGRDKKIRINRIHMEEDAGKLVHSGDNISNSAYSLPDYNRAAVPLIEIVTEPDISSADEAKAFAEQLKMTLEYADVSDVKMEQGSLRCDVNISIRPENSDKLGVKVELKNLNSFRAMYKAIEHEFKRQSALLDAGQSIVQETRLWDEANGETRPMRSKEDAHDYRYFPEPDLVPIVIDEAWMEEMRAKVPELPEARRQRLTVELGLSDYDAGQLVMNPPLARYFDQLNTANVEAKTAANWLLGDISRLLNESEKEYSEVPVDVQELVYLLNELKKGAINNNSAKTVLEEIFATEQKAADVIAAHGFAQISDSNFLQQAIKEILSANPQAVQDYRAGKKAAAGFLVGQVMKQTKGQANSALVKEMLEAALA
ncbi:MAG: Asp-tRNA(Asn)/Glu-tRNA(Gln) amidotransferase subunit GatB [Bacillota bacterium]|nr:Asp-tRNA(Asn)/Glu-tRNA(Gln) amidotransferase subunit GatB [Bacillota bacterium]